MHLPVLSKPMFLRDSCCPVHTFPFWGCHSHHPVVPFLCTWLLLNKQIIQPSKFCFQYSVWISCFNKPQFLVWQSPTNPSLLFLFSIPIFHLPTFFISLSIYLHSYLSFSLLWCFPEMSLVFFMYTDFIPCTIFIFLQYFSLSFHLLSQFLAVLQTSWPHSALNILYCHLFSFIFLSQYHISKAILIMLVCFVSPHPQMKKKPRAYIVSSLSPFCSDQATS